MSSNERDGPSVASKNIYVLQAQARLGYRGFRLRRDHEPPDETLLSRRPLYYITFLLIVSSGILRQPLLFVAGLLIFVLAFIPEIWYRYCLRQLRVSRQPSSTRLMPGETIEISFTIENRKPLPLPWCEIVDEMAEALSVKKLKAVPAATPERSLLTHTFSLWAYQRVRRRYQIQALGRGAYRFGPMTLRATDPFGILTRETHFEAPAAIVVHPLVVPLERFGLPALAPFGDRKAPRRLLEDPLRVSGIRDYIPGDEVRRIHWKATARMGGLQSKIYEPSTSHTVAIFLDIRTLSPTLMGYDPALAELHICAAASVADWAINAGYAVGIFANGTLGVPEFLERERLERSPATETAVSSEDRLRREIERTAATLRMRIPPSSRKEQLTHILDSLARIVPYHGLPIEQLIAAEERDLPPGATIVYIGTEDLVDVPMIIALRRLQSHGHAVSALLTQSNQAPEAARDNPGHHLTLSGLNSHYIGGKVTWEELVRDTLGQEALTFFQNQRRGFTGYTAGTAASPTGGQTSSATETLDTLDAGSGEQNGAEDVPISQPTSNPDDRRRSRPLVVD
jgi:uncharacterized protein (DUF58 family)